MLNLFQHLNLNIMFILQSDYPSVIHSEILTALTRGDTTLVDDASNKAIEEMKGYLSARYDVNTLFSQTGSNRNIIVLKYALDIAVYNLYMIHNPIKLTQIRQIAFNRAIKWLEDIQAEKINPTDLPVYADVKNKSELLQGSNPKRHNHF